MCLSKLSAEIWCASFAKFGNIAGRGNPLPLGEGHIPQVFCWLIWYFTLFRAWSAAPVWGPYWNWRNYYFSLLLFLQTNCFFGGLNMLKKSQIWHMRESWWKFTSDMVFGNGRGQLAAPVGHFTRLTQKSLGPNRKSAILTFVVNFGIFQVLYLIMYHLDYFVIKVY